MIGADRILASVGGLTKAFSSREKMINDRDELEAFAKGIVSSYIGYYTKLIRLQCVGGMQAACRLVRAERLRRVQKLAKTLEGYLPEQKTESRMRNALVVLIGSAAL